MTVTPSPAPDWYPDPEDSSQARYWDGSAWTDQRRPAEAQLVPSTSHMYRPPTGAVEEESRLTFGESFWYVVENIALGAGYLAKVPTKKALSDVGLCELTGAEGVWYIIMNIFFGGGYLAKVPVKRALNESRLGQMTAAEKTWYILMCIAFGAGYFAKVPVRKAFADVGIKKISDGGAFWYVLQCIAFGHGYFIKVPVKKALSELTQIPTPAARV
jgi:hypothetical protein